MTAEIQIHTLAQISELNPEQFNRMLPDLIEWFRVTKKAQKKGMTSEGFCWVDDGRMGETSAIEITIDGVTHRFENEKFGVRV